MFGDQAVRLLRESWGGVIQPDVNGNLVERGATALAEELYAMFDDAIPQTQNAPLTVNKTNPNAPGLTVNNPLGGSSFDVNGGNTSFNGGNFSIATPQGNVTIDAGTIAIPASNITIGPTAAGGKPGIGIRGTDSAGATGADGKPGLPATASLDLPPIADITAGGVNIADALGGTATSSFLGRVVSGSGARYTVDLYAAGPDATATDRVAATVPQIDPAATLAAGTWIAAVHRFLTNPGAAVPVFAYAFQPPVWL